MLRSFLLVVVSALALASAHAVTVRLTGDDGARVQVALHPGDVLRIELPAEPVAGKTWSVQGRAPSQLTKLGATQRVFGGRMSDQGTSSFAWRAISDGEGELTLIFGTATARGTATSRAATPEKSYTVALTVAGEPLGAEEAHPVPVSHMEEVAAYERAEPCGDCAALTEQLVLYRAPGETPYMMRRVYKDAPGGTLTSVMTGAWSTSQGMADPTATVYALVASSEASLFRRDGEQLTPLDGQQIPVPGAAAFHKMAVP